MGSCPPRVPGPSVPGPSVLSRRSVIRSWAAAVSPALPKGDGGGSDDLRVRVHGGVALVPVEPPRRGLVTVPGVRVHCGDNPILRDPARGAEHPVLAGIEVLAQHSGQQRRGLLDRLGELPSCRTASTAYPSRAREAINTARASGS